MPAIDKIVLGTVQFGLDYGINNRSGKPGQGEIFSILRCALDRGIRVLDTAEAYGDSQEVIGKFHASSSRRFKIITKYGQTRKDLPEGLIDRVRHDISTLGVESLYGYMFHSFNDFTNHFSRCQNDLAILKKEKLISKFGVSVYTNEEALQVIKHDEVNFIQLPFNLLDNNEQRGDVIREAKNHNIEVHTRSVFLQGLFFKELSTVPPSLTRLIPYLQQIQMIAREYNVDFLRLSLNYVLQQELINSVLIGVDTVQQLEKNVEAINFLPQSVLRRVDELNVDDSSLLNPSTWKNAK